MSGRPAASGPVEAGSDQRMQAEGHVRARAVVWAVLAVTGLLVVAVAVVVLQPAPVTRVWVKVRGEKTVEDRLAEYGLSARARLEPAFRDAGVSYPPARVVLVGLKRERALQVYAASGDGPMRFVKSYPILAASGHAGPKLREGDRQVPEGLYRVVFLNPNSRFHLSLRLDYPNEFDREMAERDGRANLGGDIMIHGAACSIGCLAMGDPASEELFVLAADTGIANIEVILSPTDFRTRRWRPKDGTVPEWTTALYQKIADEMRKLPPGG